MGFTRLAGILVLLIAVASLVFGVMFVIQGNDGRQTLINDLSPLPLDQLDAKYDTVKAGAKALAAVEEPAIQAGTALPSAKYAYYSALRTSLGLARTNAGLTQFIITSGYVAIAVGVGLALVGATLCFKAKA